MSGRAEYIDIAKGLGILAVIWGHIIVGHWTGKLVYSFHMPLFFFISGMLFRKEKYPAFGPFVKVRARRLLVPYVIYSVITWAFWSVFHAVTHSPVESYWAPLLETFIARGSGQFMVHNSPLWFIPCLFAVELMYYPISKCKDLWTLAASIGIAGLSILLEYSFGLSYLYALPWNLDAAMMALPFYAIGNLWMRHSTLEKVDGWVKRHVPITVALVVTLTSCLVWTALRFRVISMGYSDYGNEYIFHVRALLGCFSTILFSALLSHAGSLRLIRNFLDWLGRVSLDVMCIHVPVKGVIILGMAALLHMSASAMCRDFLLALVAFILAVTVVSVLVMFIDWGRKAYKESLNESR